MADSAITRCVFLDTEIFDHHMHGYAEGNLARLVKLATHANVKFILTTVTEREIRSHLEIHAKKTIEHLRSIRRLPKTAKKYLPEGNVHEADQATVQAELNDEFDDFLQAAAVEIVDVKKVNAEEVMNMYFNEIAPFGNQDKKFEFPDTIAFLALRSWCSDSNEKLYVVTGDKDWVRACKNAEQLHHVKGVNELLELFQDSIIVVHIKDAFEAQREKIEEMIREEIQNLDYYVSDDDLLEGEFEDLEIEALEIEDYQVVEISNGNAIISVDCAFTAKANAIGEDPDSGTYDHETGATMFRHRQTAEIRDEISLGVNIKVEYNKLNYTIVKFTEARSPRRDVELNIDTSSIEEKDEDMEYYDDYHGDLDPTQETDPYYDHD